MPPKKVLALLLAGGLVWQAAKASPIDRTAKIYPDYIEITIPPNIAPLNFVIEEPAKSYRVIISGENGRAIRLTSRFGKIMIPLRKWRTLLEGNRGKSLKIVVAVKEQGQWREFRPIVNHVAEEPISQALVYRLIKPLYVYWKDMGIYERDLTGFEERPILHNRNTGDNCVNCHAFADQRGDRMLLHLRAGAPGTAMLLAAGNRIRKIDTSTEFNRAVAYRDWHPSGKWIAFSANTVNQFFHAVGENRDVYDKASDLVLYDVENNRITGSPKVATEMMETYPEWSPDGRTLYFCRTDPLEKYDPSEHPYRKIKYDLMRIACDPERGLWGEVEPVFEASRLGKSVTHPKVSPDGRYLLFCLAEYGNFSIYRPDSDLYLLDLQTGEVREARELNSDKSESYHCWDASGHWVVFSSKREDGLCARPYFSRFDGRSFSKPFVLPQKDPTTYRRLIKTYNVPELVVDRVKVDRRALLKAAWSKAVKVELDPELGRRKQDEADEMWKPAPKP